ncbi:MAG: hypothetical protein M0042_13345 [Nitrospiraceae bacterium]|nr:hypothetical protein [Nitrospiraceae bacterium]
MTIILIIAAGVLAIYAYAAVAYYQGFKNWYPFCGCKGSACALPENAKE